VLLDVPGLPQLDICETELMAKGKPQRPERVEIAAVQTETLPESFECELLLVRGGFELFGHVERVCVLL